MLNVQIINNKCGGIIWCKIFSVITIAGVISLQNCKSASAATNESISQHCGTLTINSLNPQLNITIKESLKIPHSTVLKITEKLVGASLFVKSGCLVEICGVAARTNTADDTGACNGFWKSKDLLPRVPFNDMYSMTALSCACEKNRDGCENISCADDVLAEDDCAILYQEKNCQNCYYNGIHLKDRWVFKSDSSAAIKSSVIRKYCALTMKTKGALWSDNSYDITYTETQHSMAPFYHMNLGGEEFQCNCTSGSNISKRTTSKSIKLNTTPSTLTTFNIPEITYFTSSPPATGNQDPNSHSQEDSKHSKTWIIAIFTIAGVIVSAVITGIIIRRNYCSENVTEIESCKNPTVSVLSDNTILHFQKGKVLTQDDFGIELKALSEGYATAMLLPYDAKFEIPRAHFIIDVRNVLGEGNYGIVYKGSLKVAYKGSDSPESEYIEVAIKTVRPFVTDEFIRPLLNEIKVNSYIGNHPNIVYFLGACTLNLRNGDIYNILEYCGMGSLKKYLKSIKPVPPPVIVEVQVNCDGNYWDPKVSPNANAQTDEAVISISEDLCLQLVQFCIQIARGMEFLSSKNVVHIDLAARNVLLTKKLIAKIGDFGLSRKLYNLKEYKKSGSEGIPIGWTALECLKYQKFSSKSDVWAYGVVLFEIFSFGEKPYKGKSPGQIISILNSGSRLKCPEFATNDTYALMNQCWNENPELRPTFKQLEAFFTKYAI